MHWRFYINNFTVEKVNEKLQQLQAKMYRSQCKRDKLHIITITVWCYSFYMNHSAQYC